MPSIVINDKHIQPPTAQKMHTNAAEVVEKGLQKDRLTVDALDETTTPVGSLEASMDQLEEELPSVSISATDYLARSKEAYDTSTSFFDNNIRSKLDDSIRAFHNEHKTSSHFSTSQLGFTSKIYRPKTRSVMNKYEAAADTAFFSNPDVISVEAENPSNKQEIVSAAVTKALMQYRLTKTIPWYQVVMGGWQDAQVQGLAIAHYYWKIKTAEKTEVAPTGEMIKSKYLAEDKPAVDLIPLENFRFDPNANWIDIVNSSPFLIYLRPMFVGDLKVLMEKGYFKKLDDSVLAGAAGSNAEQGSTTRSNRSNSATDPRDKSSRALPEYEVVVVQEHIHRINGADYVWYTLNNEEMLRDPVPLEDIYFTGDRQFVIGQVYFETHNPYSTSTPTLLSGVQEEINEIANQRLNNVKLVMNKKYIVKTDSEVDLSALLRNQPGSAVFTQDPEKDIKEISTPDVTQSSYLEQDRLNGDFDDLAGAFNPTTLQGQGGDSAANTWHGMQMLNSSANVVLEHQLRIFSETFLLPLLRGLIKLEAKYETDETVLGVVSQQQSQMLIKYGMSEVTDEMLNADLVVKVNVGMNNTDPMLKQAKLMNAIFAIEKIMQSPVARGFDMKEIVKETFANAGFGDGTRFINQEVDPVVASLQQEITMLKQKMIGKEVDLQKTRENNQTKLGIASMKEKGENTRFMADKAFQVAQMPVQSQAPTPPAPPKLG